MRNGRRAGMVVSSLLAIACATSPSPELPLRELDLLAHPFDDLNLHVGAYVPRVDPQVRCLRSRDDAAQFAIAAWGEANDALNVDYDREQIVVVAWGALRADADAVGAGIDLLLEGAVIRDGTLHLTVRSVLPPGTGTDLATDGAGLLRYPSLFVRTERTDRVEVDLVGARRRSTAADFAPMTTSDLVVRIAPDSCPARERMSLAGARRRAANDRPQIDLVRHGDVDVLEVAWGKLDSGSYHLRFVGMVLDGDVAHLTLQAENVPIMIYSGPGEHWPGLAVQMPPVAKVHLHIARTGIALPADQPDFEPQTNDRLAVTVDTTALHRTP